VGKRPCRLRGRSSSLRVAGLAVALSVVLVESAEPQGVTGGVQGLIAAPDGRPLDGIRITAAGRSLQGERVAQSDAGGHFRLLALPPGAYTVRFSRIGYREMVLENVPVRLNRTTALGTISLEAQVVDLAPVIVEAAGRPVIDPTTTTLGATLDSEVFEALPTERDYLSVVTLLPQANQSFYGDPVNISGATGFDNAYYMDGVNVTEPYRGDGALRLPYNFIDHIELQTGGSEAEYGRFLGGTVSVVTSAGGNEHRGSVFGFFTNSGLSSRTPRGVLDLGTGGFTRYDVGGSLGGPVIRDRLWYFLAYDAEVQREEVQLPGLDVRTDESLAHRLAAKLTWRVTPRTDLALTVLGDPTNRDLVGNVFHAPTFPPRELTNPDPFLAELRTGGVALSLRGKHVVGQHVLFEGSLARFDTRFVTEGATERGRSEKLFQDAPTATWSGGHGNAWDHHSVRTSASVAGTYYFGDHSVKGGVQYEENLLDEEWVWAGLQDEGTSPITKFAENFYAGARFDLSGEVRNRIASVFGQASLRLHPRLRLNAGLRWDGQYLKGLTSGLAGSITDQWQPRVGLILYPGRGESQKLTASYARFYEQIPNLTVNFWYVGGAGLEISFFDRNPLEDPSGATPVGVVRQVTRAVDELEGQHYDEFAVGYERVVGRRVKITVRGIYRTLREILTTFTVVPDTNLGGNPGRGRLSVMPEPEHRYLGLEFSLSRFSQQGVNFLASYVLSRTHGNYTGLFDQDRGVSNPHSLPSFFNLLSLENSTGLLPNDRPHVFKAFGSYRFGFGLTAGTSFSLQSGTPLDELGGNHTDPVQVVFLRPRGAAGRTPFLWDWNVRLAFDMSRITPFGSILKLDVLHAFSAKRPVKIEERRFLAAEPDGTQISPNPIYLEPLAFQPPMTVRLGAELRF
jgi:hypothetical protein